MSQQKPWLVIAGGGTGGHLYPGLAVGEAMRASGFDVTVFGTQRPIDKRVTLHHNYPLVEQDVLPFTLNPISMAKFLTAWSRSVRFAKTAFQKRPPRVVLGLGGYASGPPIVAASKLGIPTALFNPDAVPGLANRRLASRVDRIFVQWYETSDHFGRSSKVRCTGCPIRSDFSEPNRQEAMRSLKLDPKKKTLLVTGASQGAWSINAAVLRLIPFFQENPDWQLVHLTGPADLEGCRQKYKESGLPARTIDFTENMPGCMAAADLVISRAGASTLAEITAMGLPSLLMPYPFDRKQHQMANARVLFEANAAVLIEDRKNPKANAKALREELAHLMDSDHRRERMGEIAQAMGRHDAAHAIVEGLLELVESQAEEEDD